MNPREQTPLAPFRVARVRREGSSQDEAFSFQCAEPSIDEARAQAKGPPKRICSGRPTSLQAAPHDLARSIFRSPGLPSMPFRHGHRCFTATGGPGGFEQREALGGCPKRGALRDEAGCAPGRRKLRQPALPFTLYSFPFGDAVMEQERVVHFLGITGFGPSLAAHSVDGTAVQGPQVGGSRGIQPTP